MHCHRSRCHAFAKGTVLLLSFAATLTGTSRADETTLAARWEFGAEESTPLTTHGGVQRDQAGPQPPEFPGFADGNTAVRLDGKGARLVFADPGPGSRFDFANGDAITIEAWVKVVSIRDGQPMYVVGKGRTGSPQFPRDNQNWALRIVGDKSEAHLSFLFATPPAANGAHWHRWTSKAGLKIAEGWHHIAAAYRFGEPDSIRGWIDGRATDGVWDMGGATKDPPVVDDDAIWIGSSMGGNVGSSFDGWLDSVAVHRTLLDDKTMAERFRRVGGPRVVGPRPEVMPDIANIPPGRVVVTFAEGLAAYDRWLNEDETWPPESARWQGDEFLLPRIPLRFDDWGIRMGWNAPLLMRMAADVDLPPGRVRFLVRARSLGRLWVDGQLVTRTKAASQQPPNGEEPVTPVARPLLPGMRLPGYRQQEVFGELTLEPAADGGPRRCRVVWECVVGGKNIRTETGEICVAWQSGDDQPFVVLRPQLEAPLPLTDAAVSPALARIESSLTAYDDQTRRAAAAKQDAFWRRRHELARQWSSEHPAPQPPEMATSGAATTTTAPGRRAAHPIDAFIADKIDRALAAAAGVDAKQSAHFHEQVLPILRDNCFRCHGEKDKGGLRLNSREAALKAGDSETPAVVPGKPDASELLARASSTDDSLRMPPVGDELTREQIAVLERWIRDGAGWPAPPVTAAELALSPLVGDEAFLRRAYLDLVGLPPSAAEARAFLADEAPDKRRQLVERLIADDDRFAEHWISFWQDLLAENPTLLNASLNSTGPFRWFVVDSLRDEKPLDRMVTELLMLRGGTHEGGSAGFGMAAENDSPFAAKGHIVASAFLGIELQCARCHDSPYHSTLQRDLYALAAMFERKPVTVPATSRVPAAFFDKQMRESLIRVTLKPGEPVAAVWPFAEATGAVDGPQIDRLMLKTDDTRERLAALITTPQNGRFSRVVVNRIWKQLIGAGMVEPAHDWEGRDASHPELLAWLADQLVTHDYDVKHVIRLIVTSDVYQRAATGRNLEATAGLRFFQAPDRRRLSAEQIVDSLHASTGSEMDVEELTFVHDGRRPISNRLTLGKPTRAWMFASLNNERDRPSLSLPRARVVADVLEAFGWTGSRQKPIPQRETDPNVLQSGILANGTLSMTLTRASHGSDLAQLAVDAESPGELVETLFLRVLGRRPKPEEREAFVTALATDFSTRLAPTDEIKPPEPPPPLPLVTWFNHLQPQANVIQQENERRVRLGRPSDPRLRPAWREVYEDAVWSLINHREFVWIP